MQQENRILRSSAVILDRMREALGVTTDVDLAAALGVAPTTVSSWRKRNSIPFAQCVELAERTCTSLNWLLLGIGPKDHTISTVDGLNVTLLYLAIRSMPPALCDEILFTIDEKVRIVCASYQNYLREFEELLETGKFTREEALAFLERSATDRTSISK